MDAGIGILTAVQVVKYVVAQVVLNLHVWMEIQQHNARLQEVYMSMGFAGMLQD